MKVILLSELKGKGGEGDVIDVARGFAVNYLFPRKMALEATRGNLKQLEQRRANIAKREAKRIANAEELKAQLATLVVKVDAKVGEEGQLFGSVTPQMIADALKNQEGIEIDRRRIDLKTPIKVAGIHEVSISLYRDIRTSLKVAVATKEEIPVEELVSADEPEDGAVEDATLVEAQPALEYEPGVEA